MLGELDAVLRYVILPCLRHFFDVQELPQARLWQCRALLQMASVQAAFGDSNTNA